MLLYCSGSDQVLLTDRPVTVQLSARGSAPRSADESLQLRIEGVSTRPSQTTTLRVFVDLPSANRSTPIDDSRFIGYLTLVPRRASTSDPSEERNFILDFPQPYANRAVERALPITLVPVTGTSKGPTVTIKRIRLTATPSSNE